MSIAPLSTADADTAPIASDGLTLDTADGPADWVVAQRLLEGRPTPATPADTQLAYVLAKGGVTRTARSLARALGVDEKTARRGIDRARSAAKRAADTDTAQAVAA